MCKVKCAICGSDNEIEGLSFNKLITPTSNGGKLYFDLWHFPLQKCYNCGYVSKDISICQNQNIVYKSIANDTLEKLQHARFNQIEDYMKAGEYYSLIGDKQNHALCLLQAGDLVYDEMIYWKEEILDEGESCEDIQAFAESLYSEGLKVLEEYVSTNHSDIDMQLLLVGLFDDNDEISKSKVILENIKKQNITNEQRLIVQFLEN